MTDADLRALYEKSVEENRERPDFLVPLHLDVPALMTLVAQLQLAARHPMNTGATGQAGREIIALIIQKIKDEGFPFTAAMMELGNNRALDYDPRQRK
jgi:hypothetical protein